MALEDVVASNILRIRRARGLTQERLALEAGVALRYVGMIERAETSATVGMLGKLADALEVKPAELFEELPSGE